MRAGIRQNWTWACRGEGIPPGGESANREPGSYIYIYIYIHIHIHIYIYIYTGRETERERERERAVKQTIDECLRQVGHPRFCKGTELREVAASMNFDDWFRV